MRNAPPVIVRWQQPLSRLWRFGAAALDKAIGSRTYVGVRPPKNEQLNLARDTLFRFDTSSEPPVTVDEIQMSILRALCGIGEILEELRPAINIQEDRL